MGNFKLSKRSLSRLNNVEAVLIAIFVDAIKDSPHDFGIPRFGGHRTAEDQHSLYAQRPKITTKDGYKKKSKHQSGRAIDIFAYVDGKATWDPKYYEPIARHIQKVALEQYNIKLRWGGDWKTFVDRPHFQL